MYRQQFNIVIRLWKDKNWKIQWTPTSASQSALDQNWLHHAPQLIVLCKVAYKFTSLPRHTHLALHDIVGIEFVTIFQDWVTVHIQEVLSAAAAEKLSVHVIQKWYLGYKNIQLQAHQNRTFAVCGAI